jgi:triacylglycerol esterase/lipase EstA (alpha/beta hydrolase family)
VKLGENLVRVRVRLAPRQPCVGAEAAALGESWLKAWRESSGNKDAKLILVGHSMGGVISRYYLECLDGWRDTRTLVTFGTPYRGSLKAISNVWRTGWRRRSARSASTSRRWRVR